MIELAKSDSNAFAMLYDHYVDVVYSFVLRRNHDEQLAQEITAVTFEKALKNLGRFQWQGNGLRPWLLRIARNELISHHRRQRFWSFLSFNHASELNLERQFEEAEAQRQVHEALQRLKATDQEVLTLRFFDELETAEIAAILGCSTDNVYLRLHRALKRLGQELNLAEPVEIGENLYVWQKKIV
ncbi:MAG: sigma-70 family RNA polymerase sigma factor [Caldilineaceae bacterium]